MLRFLFLAIFLISGLQSNAQKSVNDYKYILVPRAFDAVGKEDGYQLNSLTKFLFNKYGYKAFMRGENIPDDLSKDGCKALNVKLLKKPGLFVTKLAVELIDCSGHTVFTSIEGSSREKDFKKGYQEALRMAFKDVQKLNYTYNEASEKANTEKVAEVPKSTKEKPASSTDEIVNNNSKAPEVSNVVALSEKELKYTLNEYSFMFKKQEYGYELFKIEGKKSNAIGKAYKLKRDNSYLIKAGDLSGAGYYDSYGNFIIERINPATNRLILDTMARSQ